MGMNLEEPLLLIDMNRIPMSMVMIIKVYRIPLTK